MRQANQGFGKRGRVEITPEPPQPSGGPSDMSWMKYAAGGIGAIFLLGLVMGGTGGGGGLLGGILGGLLGHHLSKKMGTPTASAAPGPARPAAAPAATAAQSGPIQRGGFGFTGGSTGGSSSASFGG